MKEISKKRVYIVNPIAGHYNQNNIINEILTICYQKGYDFSCHKTEYPNHATEIVKQYKNAILFSVGGDGTLNEVVNGFRFDDGNQLSIIPCGSGNDFYRSIDKNTNMIDIGVVNERKFANIVSIGIDADIAQYANEFKKQGYISTAYLRGIYKALKHSQSIETDHGLTTLIAICNGTTYGNGFQIAPFAQMDDGYLDFCKIDPLTKLKMMKLLLKLKCGNHMEDDAFHHKQITDIQLSSSIPLTCNIDGEIMQSDTFQFHILPHYIRYFHEVDPNIKQLLKKR